MKMNLKTIVPALAMAGMLSACGMTGSDSTPSTQAAATTPAASQQSQQQPQQAAPRTVQVDSIDSTKEVAYKCGNNGQNPLTVMYGLKDGEVVVAQVKYQNKTSPGLFRVIDNNDMNVFVGENITWATDKANAANVDKVNGNMLTQEVMQTVNGQQMQVSQIVTRMCMLDKAGTARLARAAKK
ncbi:hypothetical protein [Neisseria montereyensis]|uniref:Lipoprotein n=1 Tax=Neisseria montereyensis TaxID=2973938 RepID=A0ABT2FBN4_9NEIS|nr:hypothetical protein [Neisseria montereyensis]MCS4533589.1 hypothetical protein [Neisseria montereyensis]